MTAWFGEFQYCGSGRSRNRSIAGSGGGKLCQIIELKLIWELYNLQPDGKRAI